MTHLRCGGIVLMVSLYCKCTAECVSERMFEYRQIFDRAIKLRNLTVYQYFCMDYPSPVISITKSSYYKNVL